ncbi:MAG: TolB-like 6-bladed beta-propeller domain-containing protein [Prevotellaceae bacterium]|jgi:WD40 repeat protein|nr:TolB-like 6-bladed beta-propeller domain-containing protein [Prevotellaceae bacterium]
MRKIVHLLFFTLLIGCEENKGSKLQEIVYEDITSLPKQEIRFEKKNIGERLMVPRRIWIEDSVLIVNDQGYSDGFLRFYSMTSGRFLAKFGTIGPGPYEYVIPRFTKIRDSIIVISVNGRCTFLSIRDLANNDFLCTSLILKDKVYYSSNYFFPIKDTLFIATMTSEYQFFLYNNRLNTTIKVNNYPLAERKNNVSDFCLNMMVYDAFYTIKPDKEKLIVAYKNYPIVDIIQPLDFTTLRIEFRNKIHNHYKVIDQMNVQFENQHIQYTFAYCTDKYFYLLYQNATKEMLEQNENKSEIHVFDWNGNLIKRYVSDLSIYNLAVSNNNDYLYALGLDENLDPQLYMAEI